MITYTITIFLPVMMLFSSTLSTTQTIHLYGDSISRGYGFRQFEYPSPINSIWGMGNMLLAENGYGDRFGYRWTQDPNAIWANVQEGIVKPGDIIIFENAGPHFNDTEGYRLWLKLIKFTAHWQSANRENLNTHLFLTTMFDYNPGPLDYNSCYDEILPGGLSINDVVRQEAIGENLLDWNAQMDEAVAYMADYSASPMHSDGIHPNIFGNFLLTISILHKAGYEINNYETVRQEFLVYRSQYPALFGFSLTETQIGEVLAGLKTIAEN